MTMNRCWGLPLLLLGVWAAGPIGAAPDQETANAIARLALQRRDAARKTYQVLWLDYRERIASEDALYRWSVRWLDAERELSDQQADQMTAYQGHFERMRDLERLIRRLRESAQTTIDEASAAEFYRTEAEMWLLQAKEVKKKP
jgi:hypothetical protein